MLPGSEQVGRNNTKHNGYNFSEITQHKPYWINFISSNPTHLMNFPETPWGQE